VVSLAECVGRIEAALCWRRLAFPLTYSHAPHQSYFFLHRAEQMPVAGP